MHDEECTVMIKVLLGCVFALGMSVETLLCGKSRKVRLAVLLPWW